jgi:hypothetical protein
MQREVEAGWVPRYHDADIRHAVQGFVTSRNRFVDRKEARRLFDGKDGILFSEDLY